MSSKGSESVPGGEDGALSKAAPPADLASCVRYLAHELRNTLSATTGWVRVLRQIPLPADVAKAVEAIERNLRLHGALTEDLVDAAFVAAGGSLSAGTSTEVMAAVEQAQNDVAVLAQRREVRLERASPDPALRVAIEQDRLRRMLSALLRSVIETAPRQSVVSLRVAPAEAAVDIRIEGSSHASSTVEIPTSVRLVAILAQLHGGSLTAAGADGGAPTSFSLRLPSG